MQREAAAAIQRCSAATNECNDSKKKTQSMQAASAVRLLLFACVQEQEKNRNSESGRGHSDGLCRYCRDAAMQFCVCTQGLSGGQDVSRDICTWSVGLERTNIPVRRHVANTDPHRGVDNLRKHT